MITSPNSMLILHRRQGNLSNKAWLFLFFCFNNRNKFSQKLSAANKSQSYSTFDTDLAFKYFIKKLKKYMTIAFHMNKSTKISNAPWLS